MKIHHAFAAALAILCTSSAHAFKITPAGTFELSYLFDPPSTSSGTGWGYGVLVGQDIRPDIEIESGLLYIARDSNQGNPTSNTSTYYYEQIPVLIRIRPKDSHCTFGVGGYYAHGVGNIRNQPSGAGSATYASYEDMQVSRDDFGALVALGFRWEFLPRIEFYADTRFALGLKNINLAPGGPSEQWRDYLMAIGGLSFSLTGKS